MSRSYEEILEGATHARSAGSFYFWMEVVGS
jgi:hypothetical protein